MVNINIAYDNNDPELGAYFERSKSDLLAILEDNHIDYSTHLIHSLLCNEVYIETRIQSINSQNFLFVAYSHGKEDSLIVSQISYVDVAKNTNLFINSLFYTTACLAGEILGEDLIAKGCQAFIGYKGKILVFKNEYQNISLNCDNCGIRMFISGDSIGTAFDKMKDYYTQQIDRLLQFGDPLSSAILVDNREALVFFGNRDLTIQDF